MILNGVDACNWCGTAFYELEGVVLHLRLYHNRFKGDCMDRLINDLEKKYQALTVPAPSR